MSLIKTVPPTYHLISLDDQVLFQNVVTSHQSLAINKSVLMNAISRLYVSQMGFGHEGVTSLTPVLEVFEMDVGNVSQDTLGSLTGMANRLAEQKKGALKQQQLLDGRDLALQEKEHQWRDKEDDLRQRHKQVLHDRDLLAQASQDSAQMISEHSAALQQLTEDLDARERASARLFDLLQQENTRAEALSALLEARLAQLQKREGELQRGVLMLREHLKHLKNAKDRFSVLVKNFNQTAKLRSAFQTSELKLQEQRRGHVEPN